MSPAASTSQAQSTPSTPEMEYRRFGQTEESLSVLTLGGMRFAHGWDPPRSHLPKASIDNAIDTTRRALELGINHIETAHGYMKSEHLFGYALRELAVPRSQYKMMTKGAPMTADETRSLVEEQLTTLGLDHVEFYGWHGINNEERLQAACAPGGPVETLHRLREEGVIRHVGFSTHAPLNIILKAINTGLFSFVNLHYYYFFQHNLPAVQLAGQKDMGVLIISPNDKGGQLWNSPQKVRDLCAPLSPIQFNGRFCLSHPQVTTLTLGMHAPEHFSTNTAILGGGSYLNENDTDVKLKLDRPLMTLADRCTTCTECLPCPEDINIPEVLRFRNLKQAYGMRDFGRYRYNMLESKGHWFPGAYASACTECGDCLPRCPEQLDIPRLLAETHRSLFNRRLWLKNKAGDLAASCYRFFKTLFS